MPEINEKDVFLSYATEDREWAEMLAERLRSEGVRVWFDQWELQPGDHLKKINDGLKHSRKVVAIWTPNYFRDDKVWTLAESYAKQSPDVLSRERPLIPLLRQDCDIEPLFRPLIFLDCRNNDDFELRFRQLIEALDLPHSQYQYPEEGEFELREHSLDVKERGRRNYAKGKRFEDEVAALYRVLGFEVKADTELSGVQIDLMIRQKSGGLITEAIVECKDKRITADERNQILAQQAIAQKKLPRHRWIAVSSQGFAADTRVALEETGIDCVTYAELLRELIPLDNYADGLIAEYEKDAERKWEGEDWFIRPDLVTDITYERMPALQHLSKWLGESRRNQLVILGDLGTGKTTLASFLAYNLARSFRDDPLRHPAPVLIPLKEVRKQIDLEGIVINHFTRRGLRDISFTRFEHLVRLGKIILFFDAFDEMADRIRWEDTQSNFRELSRAADLQGKVILTCRTHYFKDRTEQVKVIGQGPKLSETETDLYRELRQRSTAEVVFLQEFDDEKIQDYLRKARPKDHSADWRKIQEIWNLKDLATRPLLLDMVVKTLPKLKLGEEVNAASLYNVYTAAWIDREEDKGRKFRLDKTTKFALMLELAWRMWCDEKPYVHHKELVPFIEKLVADQKIEIGDEEIADIASEMQGASFLKRDDKGSFSFMHRSFGEYFVAKKINDSLSNPEALHEVLNTRRYDQKTIFFLSLLDEADVICQPLQQILRNKYQQNISENALQLLYWSARIRCGMEEEISDVPKLKAALAGRIPTEANLVGAKLQDVIVECAELIGADLTGADLRLAKLNYCKLDNAVFLNASLVGTQIENASAIQTNFREANVDAASFNDSNLRKADFTDAQNWGLAKFLRADTASAAGLELGSWRVFTKGSESLKPIVQLGTSNALRAVSYSPDGKLLAAGGEDGVIRIYGAEDGVLLRTLEGHSSEVNSVTFSPDGQTLASGSNDHSIKLWQVKSGEKVCSLDGHKNRVLFVTFSPDGKVIASGSSDNSVKLWQAKSGKEIRSLSGHSDAVWSAAFSPDGKVIASGSSDHSVHLWQVESGKKIRSLTGHSNGVLSVAFSPDGEMIASGSSDNLVKLWRVNSGKEIRRLTGHSNAVWSVAFSPNGEMIASGSSDKLVKLWETNSGKEIHSLAGHFYRVWAVAFSPDGEMIASSSSDQSVKVWQVKSGKEIRSLAGHSDRVLSVAFSSDGELIASGSSDHSVKLWQVKSGKEIRLLAEHSNWVRSVAFSPDDKVIASGSDDHLVKLWQVNSGKRIRSLAGHSDWVLSVAFSPDGEMIASGSSDRSVKLWQVKSGKEIRSLAGYFPRVSSVAFSPDGEMVASGNDGCPVKLSHVKSNKEIRSLGGYSGAYSSVVFSPDGEMIASGSSDNSVKLWQVESGKEVLSLSGHLSNVNSVAFSSDGHTLASGSDDNSVKLWQISDGKLLATLTGNLGAVQAVRFAPNGKYLVSAGAAGRLQFWDVATGQTFLYRYSFGPGAWLDLLPDGRFDASPEGIRYLGYTGKTDFSYYPAESLIKEFHSPEAVQAVLDKYTK